MNFRRRGRHADEPEINVIPLIDVLLVMLIFLAATTSFARLTELQITLPEADAQAPIQEPLVIAVSRDGQYALDGVLVEPAQAEPLAQALRRAAIDPAQAQVVIHADAQATHQAVVAVMQAARQAGIERIHFAAQQQP